MLNFFLFGGKVYVEKIIIDAGAMDSVGSIMIMW